MIPKENIQDHVRTAIDSTEKFKTKLLASFNEGEITATEYQSQLNELNNIQLSTRLAAELSSATKDKKSRTYLILALAVAFLSGFFFGNLTSKNFFGYANAEECAINAKHKYAATACYDLYPSVRK